MQNLQVMKKEKKELSTEGNNGIKSMTRLSVYALHDLPDHLYLWAEILLYPCCWHMTTKQPNRQTEK
jgi:hypothetical protein